MSYFHALVRLLPLVLLVSACQGEEPEDRETPTATVAPVAREKQDFDSFYARFHEDEAYQLSRIQFPLRGVSSRPAENGDDFRWERADWQIHRAFNPAGGFRSEFIPIGEDLVVEKIANDSGTYGMERRFARLDGDEWFLIYYAALHPL